jgi:predicted Zn-dependent peptidase
VSSTAIAKDLQQVKRSVLDNGVTVVTEFMPHLRSVSMGIWVKTGSRSELAEENGITHFIEHMLFKGTANRTAEAIARSVDSIGGNLDAFTAKEMVCFNAKVMDEHSPLAFDVLSDLVLNPLFREVDIDKERGVVLQEIKMDEDNPDYLVHEIFTQNFWRDHPLGRPILGTKETIRAMAQERLFRHYRQSFSPENLVISAAGNLEHERFLELVERGIGRMAPVPNGHVEQPPHTHARINLRNKKQLEQVHVCMGVPCSPLRDDRRYGWSVLNTLLGGGMSSRLFQNIRERQGLAYAVFSDINPYSDSGVFSVYAGTSLSTVRQVIHSIVHELRDLKQNLVPEEELRRAKDNLKGSLMLGLESTGARMSNLARQEMYFARHISMDEMLRRIEAVTAEELQGLAQEAFDGDKIGLTVLGNISGLKVTRADLVV